MCLCAGYDIQSTEHSQIDEFDEELEAIRGVKIGGEGAAALIAEVVGEAGKFAGKEALLLALGQLHLHQLQQQLFRLYARHLSHTHIPFIQICHSRILIHLHHMPYSSNSLLFLKHQASSWQRLDIYNRGLSHDIAMVSIRSCHGLAQTGVSTCGAKFPYLHIAVGVAVQEKLLASGVGQELKDGQVGRGEAREDGILAFCCAVRQQLVQLRDQGANLQCTRQASARLARTCCEPFNLVWE